MNVKAELFNDAVQLVRDWLPPAEAELKFRAITEDEEGIMQLIENHEVSLMTFYCCNCCMNVCF